MRIRTIAAAVAALALPLTACGDDGGTISQSKGSCEDAIRKAIEKPEAAGDETPPPCRGFTDAELEDMAKNVVGDELGDSLDLDTEDPAEEKPAADTSLTVGQTYTYEDGLAVTVDSIKTITEIGEYDYQPEPGEQPFRVNLTIDNGTGAPYSLDDLFAEVEGATNGGTADPVMIETGAKELTGRLGAGVRTTGTSDGVLEEKYGKDVVVIVTRTDEDSWDMDAPEWSGSIT